MIWLCTLLLSLVALVRSQQPFNAFPYFPEPGHYYSHSHEDHYSPQFSLFPITAEEKTQIESYLKMLDQEILKLNYAMWKMDMEIVKKKHQGMSWRKKSEYADWVVTKMEQKVDALGVERDGLDNRVTDLENQKSYLELLVDQ
eukprot:TRINITY_DN698_c0_g1_i1.p1 TRINITY_DN698_c0_g1~~TRINITY_DN698_c0_g1_i1.p1  ORF type:complete len:157 (-),score=32.14 TRINITY_DN698_c0_g1_i1:28-456(-)